jgi:hypothetical protein
MKNVKLIGLVIVSMLLLSACKGSKCDCPSFAPKKRSNLHFQTIQQELPHWA